MTNLILEPRPMPKAKMAERPLCLMQFAECSFYEGEGDYRQTPERYQLRKTPAGGDGAVLVKSSNDLAELQHWASQRAHESKTSFFEIFDQQTLPEIAVIG